MSTIIEEEKYQHSIHYSEANSSSSKLFKGLPGHSQIIPEENKEEINILAEIEESVQISMSMDGYVEQPSQT